MRPQDQTGMPGVPSLDNLTPGMKTANSLFRVKASTQLKVAYCAIGSEAQTQAALARALAILFGEAPDGVETPEALPAASVVPNDLASAGTEAMRYERKTKF